MTIAFKCFHVQTSVTSVASSEFCQCLSGVKALKVFQTFLWFLFPVPTHPLFRVLVWSIVVVWIIQIVKFLSVLKT